MKLFYNFVIKETELTKKQLKKTGNSTGQAIIHIKGTALNATGANYPSCYGFCHTNMNLKQCRLTWGGIQACTHVREWI